MTKYEDRDGVVSDFDEGAVRVDVSDRDAGTAPTQTDSRQRERVRLHCRGGHAERRGRQREGISSAVAANRIPLTTVVRPLLFKSCRLRSTKKAGAV